MQLNHGCFTFIRCICWIISSGWFCINNALCLVSSSVHWTVFTVFTWYLCGVSMDYASVHKYCILSLVAAPPPPNSVDHNLNNVFNKWKICSENCVQNLEFCVVHLPNKNYRLTYMFCCYNVQNAVPFKCFHHLFNVFTKLLSRQFCCI